MNNVLAHAGEVHEDVVEATSHALPWYVQIILFILVMFGIGAITWLLTKKQDIVLLVCACIMLITGFAFYRVAPAVSVIAITLGLFSTLMVTLSSLAVSPAKKSKEK